MLRTRSRCRCPGRRSIFPLIVCQRPLTGAIRVHHKEFGIGLRNVVVERRFVFESETGAAEENVLAIWRPYSVCVISRRRRQPPQAGPVGPDRVNVKVTFTKAREFDEVALW